MRVALVTGAARGIGRAIAHDLAGDHATAITHHTTDPGPLLSERPDIFPIKADLSNSEEAAHVIQSVIDQFGQIDVIVNNAGVVLPTPCKAEAFDDHRLTLEVNLIAPVALLSAALPHLKPGASVINISSGNAVLPAKGASIYSASKAALNTWTRGMAKELGPRGIRVNAISPGAIERKESPRPDDLIELFVKDTALGRVGAPEDITPVVRFLATNASAFITGENISVSGGYRL
ncbi:MAG: SDR family oxidoreductase [Paracoccaceae bacterium]